MLKSSVYYALSYQSWFLSKFSSLKQLEKVSRFNFRLRYKWVISYHPRATSGIMLCLLFVYHGWLLFWYCQVLPSDLAGNSWNHVVGGKSYGIQTSNNKKSLIRNIQFYLPAVLPQHPPTISPPYTDLTNSRYTYTASNSCSTRFCVTIWEEYLCEFLWHDMMINSATG